MLIFPFLLELGILFWAFKRTGFMPFPHGIMLYSIGAQVAVGLVAGNYVTYEFLKVYSSYGFVDHYTGVFWMFFGFFICAALCVPTRKINISNIAQSINITPFFSYIFIGLLYAHVLLEFFTIDWGVAWKNSTYLLMSGESGLRFSNAVAKTNHQFSGVLGLLAFVLLTFYAFTQQARLVILTLPLAVWFFLFQLAGHSRLATFYLVTFAAAGVVLSPKRVSVPAIVSGLIGLVTLVSVLGGRTSYNHGFSSIPLFWDNVWYQLNRDTAGTFINIFEGAFASSELFTSHFEYPEIFKILSMSPLLNAIDGYEDIRLKYQILLAPVAPAGAINEIVSFGPLYAIIFFGVEFAAGFMSARYLAKSSTISALILNALMMLASYLQFAYSTRSVFRLFIIVLIGAVIGLRRERSAPKSRAKRKGQRYGDRSRSKRPVPVWKRPVAAKALFRDR